jgi:hypothetical protein
MTSTETADVSIEYCPNCTRSWWQCRALHLEGDTEGCCQQCGHMFTLGEVGDRAHTYDGKRDALLAEAAKKPVVRVEQFDAFVGVEPGDYVVTPDEDGDCLFGGMDTYEFRLSDVVRVQIPELTEPRDAVRVLRKIADWIERDYVNRGPLALRPDWPVW